MEQIIYPLIELLAMYWLNYKKTCQLLFSVTPPQMKDHFKFAELSTNLIAQLTGNPTRKTPAEVEVAKGRYYQAWYTNEEIDQRFAHGPRVSKGMIDESKEPDSPAPLSSHSRRRHWHKVTSFFG
jgi:hypothetical protein